MRLQDPANLLTGNANGYVGGQIYFDAFNVSPADGLPDTICKSKRNHMPHSLCMACHAFPGSRDVGTVALAPLCASCQACECLLQARFGSGTGGIVAFGVPTVAAFCCGAMSVASNSRHAT